MKRVMTIAGSDSGGGAGIQADLKTFATFGTYGMSAITAITAQNTVGVKAAFELPSDLIVHQIRSVLDDIGVDAVKTGMLSSRPVVELIAELVEEYQLSPLVVDPVMIAKSGDPLLSEDAQAVVKSRLIPLATVVTPNLHETGVLTGSEVSTVGEMKNAALDLHALGCDWVVVKGGHLEGEPAAVDIVFNGTNHTVLEEPFIESTNTHGTGCTFSSAITASLAKGFSPPDAIRRAKRFITAAIAEGIDIGKGSGPANHLNGMDSPWQ